MRVWKALPWMGLILVGPVLASAAGQDEKGAPAQVEAQVRDEVGDLNHRGVLEGSFPGSFRIPGTGDVSLAIGGFIKTVSIVDSHAEALGAIMLPASLGSTRSDEDGRAVIDATLSRLNFDARSPARRGTLRGYLEFDLNGRSDATTAINVRHGYGVWDYHPGSITAGHTWSTLMDLQTLPEGLTEPTVSGAIFQRQAQIRWSQPLAVTRIHVAIENPSSDDVETGSTTKPGRTFRPDLVAAVEAGRRGTGHVRLGGILRRLGIKTAAGTAERADAWGVQVSGHVEFAGKDRFYASGSYGEGLGRYLLGIPATAGAWQNPATDALELRRNYGGFGGLQHFWKEGLRSSFVFGRARSEARPTQADNAFSNTTFVIANLMWSVMPYVTLGVEYDYGAREDQAGRLKENHRATLGVQIY